MAYFILGRSGSGKTERLYRYIKELPDDSEVVLLVPEQSSFQNEKRVLADFPPKRAKNIKVLSFKRLCNVLFDIYQGMTEQRIDDGSKAVLMSMAIDNTPAEKGEMEIFRQGGKGSRRKTDLIEPMLSAVSEYKTCLITPEMLYDIAKSVKSPVLAAKLRDSARIYAAYDAILGGTYADPDDDLKRLYRILQTHRFFENKYVFVDSFSGFSAQEMSILQCVFSQAEEVYVALCTDTASHNNGSTIFAEPDETLKTLIRMCQKEGGAARLVTDLDEGIRFRSDALRNVEENVFSGFRHSGGTDEKAENDGSVMLYEACDIYDEVSFAAEIICRLTDSGKYKYSDIEIIAGDLSEYKNVIAAEFPKYDIPFFLSDPLQLETRPLIRMLTSAFDAVQSHFDTEAILRLAKTGLTSLNDNEVSELENYAYVWSIRGKRWKQPFFMDIDPFHDDRINREELQKQLDELEKNNSADEQIKKLQKTIEDIDKKTAEDKKRIDAVEASRKKLIEPLVRFEEKTDKAENGGEITKALYELMKEYDTKGRYSSYIYRLIKNSDKRTVEMEKNVWEITIGILENMYGILKDKKTDRKYYAGLFELYVRKSPFSDIPATVNSVTVGEAGNVRADAPKVVFVIGAVRTVFPGQPSASGIFTDSERRLLREGCGDAGPLPLHDSIYGNSLKEKFKAYAALTAASEKLYVSWYTQSLSGTECEPSAVISEIESSVRGIQRGHRQEITDCSPDQTELFFTERQSFDICAKLWNSHGSRSFTLKKYYLSSRKYGGVAKALEQASKNERFRLKNRDNINYLFRSPIYLSNTKLDKFSQCHFSFFCQYGLRSLPLRRAGLDSRLYGSAVHYIFEKILGECDTTEFSKKSDDDLKKLISKYLDEFLSQLDYPEDKPPRFVSACSRIRKNAFVVLSKMRVQFASDNFKPVEFELHIGASGSEKGIPAYKLKLPTGEELILTGYADRVDTAVIDSKKYVRIIDYKTGTKDFSINNVVNGFNIQMLLYLAAIEKNGLPGIPAEKLSPAGVLYVPSTASYKSMPVQNEKYIKSAITNQNSSLRLKGMLTSAKNVLESMESSLKGSYIPVKLRIDKDKKEEKIEPFSGSILVSEDDMKSVLKYVDLCMKQMGIELINGSIEAFPVAGGCDYCEYGSSCRFEKGRTPCRSQEELTPEKALMYIKNKTEGEKEDNGSV